MRGLSSGKYKNVLFTRIVQTKNSMYELVRPVEFYSRTPTSNCFFTIISLTNGIRQES